MKHIFFLWCLMSLPCLADSLNGLGPLTQQFGPVVGKPVGAGADASGVPLVQTNFQSAGLDITVISNGANQSVVSITISRDSPFSSMEIPDILKQLSTGDWTQKDDSTWTLSQSKIAAHWNGEGKISVGSD